jgi:hypothetical protein
MQEPAAYRTPLPLGIPRPIPLAPLVPLGAPPRVGIPPLPALGMPAPLLAGVFGSGAGVENLDVALLDGGFSTNEVSVVRKVASASPPSGPTERLKPREEERYGLFCGRLKDSGIGCCAFRLVTVPYDLFPRRHSNATLLLVCKKKFILQENPRKKHSYSSRIRKPQNSLKSAPSSRASVVVA